MTVMTIKYVNPPKEGSRMGSIVDTGGTRYPCPGMLVAAFTTGLTYDVPTKNEDWKSGPVVVIAGPPKIVDGAANVPNAPTWKSAAQAKPNVSPPANGAHEDVTRIAVFKSLVEAGMWNGREDLDKYLEWSWEIAPKLLHR